MTTKATTNSGLTLLGTPSTELRLEFTMPTGQSFRWRSLDSNDETFVGVCGDRVLVLEQLEKDVGYKVVGRQVNSQAYTRNWTDEELMEDFFNLKVPLAQLSENWKKKDAIFERIYEKLPGSRMLRQDPVECLFSFICSQNNHISRIHGMVNKLCEMYGSQIQGVDSNSVYISEYKKKFGTDVFYSFPSLEQLVQASEDELRAAGFGYRAKFIVGSVEELVNKPQGGREWLLSLRDVSFNQAVEELCTLPGVGPKVAACVALFSLDKHDAIPVDTHVWQFALRNYTPHLRGKPPSPKYHPEVQAAFVKRFGEYAGWAHNTLFVSELASIKKKLQIQDEESESDYDDDDEWELEGDEVKVKLESEENTSNDDVLPLTPPKDEGKSLAGRKRRRIKEES